MNVKVRINQYGFAARTDSIHGAADCQMRPSTSPAAVRSHAMTTTPNSRSQ